MEQLLASAQPAPVATGRLRAIIVPHAGYPYSGPVAASAFALLRGRHFETVVLLAPSHYALLDQASVSGADLYRTPLGDVPIAAAARALARVAPFALDPPCEVQRPAWAAQASRPLPPAGTDRADTWEHAGEVEVPFLQRTLGTFALVPAVMGNVDAAAAARAIDAQLTDDTLLVVSSDLSHYHTYAEAKQLDRECVQAIAALDVDRMRHAEACGRIPILTLLHVARAHAWKPVVLDARSSGDTAGDRSRVVGYAAVAFYDPAAPESDAADTAAAKAVAAAAGSLTPRDRIALLTLARQTLRAAVSGGPLPAPAETEFAPLLRMKKGCFVTLTKRGELRGCIGHLGAVLPLHRDVVENTRDAAIRDPRFLPVSPREVDQLRIEISVLTDPVPLAFNSPDDLLGKLRPGRDGVILQVDGSSSTYLPQVWEQLPDRRQFMDSLAEKAGLPADAWRRSGARIATYQVEAFTEGE